MIWGYFKLYWDCLCLWVKIDKCRNLSIICFLIKNEEWMMIGWLLGGKINCCMVFLLIYFIDYEVIRKLFNFK